MADLISRQAKKMEKQIDAEAKIFSTIIKAELATYMAHFAPARAVISISNILALNEGMTKYQARKALKALMEKGVVEYTSQGCPAIESEYEYKELVCEAGPPINGYALTKKGFETEEWKTAYTSWNKGLEEWANDDIFEEVTSDD